MTYEEWERIDAALEQYFPRTYHLPAASKVLWYGELQAYTYDQVIAAARHLARTEDAFPSLAMLIRAVEGTPEDNAALAWQEVVEKASQLVYPKFIGTPAGRQEVPLEWDDTYALKALEAIGGARSYLETAADTVGVVRKHFTNAYEAIVNDAKRAGTYQAPPPKAVREALAAEKRALIQAANAPPPLALPAPHEVVPMPESFPAEWRRIIQLDAHAKRPVDHRPQGAKQLAERAKHPEKVVRLADVVKEDKPDDE